MKNHKHLSLANGKICLQPIGMDAPEVTARFCDPAGNESGLFQHQENFSGKDLQYEKS